MGFYRHIFAARCLAAIALTATLVSTCFAASRKEQVLYSFQGGTDGLRPIGGVVFDQAGNLYGVTVNGGSNACRGPFECGTVYQLKPPVKQGDPWTEAVLYVFKGTDHNDGASPFGGLIFDAAGNLYGTTGYDGTGPCQLFGGQAGCGTVFKLSPPTAPGGSWTETVLYNFQGDKDGQFPMGSLVFDSTGNLYGATYYGGGFGSCNDPFFQHCGTIFELSPPKKKGGKWTEKVLYSFRNGKDGANPNGSLVFDNKGALYGAAFFGAERGCSQPGGTGCGVIFNVRPPKSSGTGWRYGVLYRFKGNPGHDGGNASPLILDKGNLYGTTLSGGNPSGDGTGFMLSPVKGRQSWKETILRTFGQPNDGAGPMSGLAFAPNGHLYGTTCCGGQEGDGTIFSLMLAAKGGWTYKNIYDFTAPPNGFFPSGSLISDQVGRLYGTTELGGTGSCQNGGCGTVFVLNP